jgi:hypothetical protein
MPSTLTIAARFRGPAGSGNGGWTSGSLVAASGLAGPVEVTLRMPPPLERALVVRDRRLLDGESLVAEARAGSLAVDVDPVDAATARSAETGYAGLAEHPFPECYVCGPARSPGDGLRLSPGPVAPGRTACTWTPAADVSTPHVWAALDCPGGWTSDIAGRPMVLGRMTAEVAEPVRPEQTYVVVGTHLATEGRKTRTATALFAPDGTRVARAEQVWIAVDPGTFG